MGNKDDAAAEGFQEGLQPVNGFDIEMVGRFVQQQHARVAHQRAAQRRFTQPAARQRRQLGIRLQADLLQHVVDTALQLPQIVVIQNGLQTSHLIKVFLAGIEHYRMRNGMVGLEVFGLFFHPFRHKVIYRAGNIARRVLLQTRHHQVLFKDDATVIQRLLPVNDLHQGRFACAVTADQTDAFVFFDMQLGIVEQRRIAEGEVSAVNTD